MSERAKEKRHVPQSMDIESFHYVVFQAKTYRVEETDEGETLLVQVDEIPDEHWQRWDDE